MIVLSGQKQVQCTENINMRALFSYSFVSKDVNETEEAKIKMPKLNWEIVCK
jgi:hypothetical protein